MDTCVCCMDVCYTDFDFANGYNRDDVGLTDASYTCLQLKNDVERALVLSSAPPE